MPAFNVPTVILVCTLVFVAVHLYRLSLGNAGEIRFLLLFSFIPARYGDLGNLPVDTFPGGLAADVWTFLTYALVHADWAHLIMNSLWMLTFGSVVARRLGAAGFVAFSLACAATGAAVMLAVYWGEFVPVIGASAAVSGQLAAAFRLMYGGGTPAAPAPALTVLKDPRALTFLAVWIAINLIFGLGSVSFAGESGRIAWEAHLGGFAGGFLLFGLFDRLGPRGAIR